MPLKSRLDDPTFLRRQLYFFTGKGGVGKTVLSLATAKAMASLGRKTLWIEMTDSPRGGLAFKNYSPGYEPQHVAPSLYAMNLKLEPALREYLKIIFRLNFIAKRIADNNFFKNLTEALPGLDSLVTLGKLEYDLNRRKGGHRFWDAVVVDAPATGHGLTLFRFPAAARDVVTMGPVYEAARRQQEIFSDEYRTAMIVAALPEELPIREGLELIDSLTGEVGFPVHSMWLNQCFLADPLEADYGRFESAGGVADEEQFSTRSEFLHGWYQIQQRETKQVQKDLNQPLFQLPFIAGTLNEQSSWLAEWILGRVEGSGVKL